MATPAIRSRRVEVGAYHDEFCDPPAMDTAEAGYGMSDSGPTH